MERKDNILIGRILTAGFIINSILISAWLVFVKDCFDPGTSFIFTTTDMIILGVLLFINLEYVFWSNGFVKREMHKCNTVVGATAYGKFISAVYSVIFLVIMFIFTLFAKVLFKVIQPYLREVLLFLVCFTVVVGIISLFIWLNSFRVDRSLLGSKKDTNKKSKWDKLIDWLNEEEDDKPVTPRKYTYRITETRQRLSTPKKKTTSTKPKSIQRVKTKTTTQTSKKRKYTRKV